jgi:outer membrane protein OmpA-like peptidoglycan-associated protein
MKRTVILLLVSVLLILLPKISGFAQGAKSDEDKSPTAPRTTLAVRYVENKKTTVNLAGTTIAPRIFGKAEVEYKRNEARIKLKVENLDQPQSFGPFYTTYIVWEVTQEGQTSFLVELPAGFMVEVNTTSPAQTFGMIITAEPHSAVKIPSLMIVAETSLPKNVTPGVRTAQAEFRVDKGNFFTVSDSDSTPLQPDYTTPRLVLSARRSVDIARRAGAKEYAQEEWQQVLKNLATLEQIWPRNLKNESSYIGLARDIMRQGQVARDLATERENQARIEDERQVRLRNLEEAVAQAERAKAEAERVKLEADRARADAERAKAEAERAKIEAERSKGEAERAERAAADERAQREQAAREAEAARARSVADRQAAERALKEAADATRERDAALQKLYVSLSEILDTKRETRGFIVNIGDVLFDTGRATLKPLAREKLSRLVGIILAYPGKLKMEIEGHTDSVGSDELNNKLSLSRAESVRDYLSQAGVKQERIKNVQGFGKTKPIASNDTSAGRQMNRRVEIVIDDEDQVKQQ